MMAPCKGFPCMFTDYNSKLDLPMNHFFWSRRLHLTHWRWPWSSGYVQYCHIESCHLGIHGDSISVLMQTVKSPWHYLLLYIHGIPHQTMHLIKIWQKTTTIMLIHHFCHEYSLTDPNGFMKKARELRTTSAASPTFYECAFCRPIMFALQTNQDRAYCHTVCKQQHA